VELMLMLRVLVLYENSKYIASFLIILLFFQIVGMFIIVFMVLPKSKSIAGHDVFTGCLLTLPSWSHLLWTLPLVVEVSLVILCVYKCKEYAGFSLTAKVLARDSIIYFTAITADFIFNLAYGPFYVLLCSSLAMQTNVLSCIAASRLSMSIRSLAMDQAMTTFAEQSRLLPTLLFVSPSVMDSTGEEDCSNQDELEDNR